jgi:undecaprenyl-phosphate 4-deoxy-4-formamido-L-arabinose transferase
MQTPDLSVIIPVYNEEEGLPALFARIYTALDALPLSYEIVFINDGSSDRSAVLLRQQFQKRPDVTRVVLLNGNFGQHMAIMAGFAHARGHRLVTLDADLQDPPEEIGNLMVEMDRGHDYVGTIRRKRQASVLRRYASRAMNKVREHITRVKMTDQGCMLRAYSRDIVDAMVSSREVNTYIPALAYTYAANPTEIEVTHGERAAGESKYSWYQLVRLNFDLITGFSVVPLQLYSILGFLVSLVSVGFFAVIIYRRFAYGSEAEGLFTLFAIAFLLLGVALFGIGLLGEYVGRIYQQVRDRPRYLIQAVLEAEDPTGNARPEEPQLAEVRVAPRA